MAVGLDTMAKKPTVKDQLDELRSNYLSLEEMVIEMRAEMKHLRDELETSRLIQAEADSGYTEIERQLNELKRENQNLRDKVTEDSKQLEHLDQYGRKYQLVLAGRVIPKYQRGEDTRAIALSLIKTHLGMNLEWRAITACHRLESRNTIFIRFVDLDLRQAIYHRRTKPIKRGLWIYESLTKSRMALVKTLQDLKEEPNCPFSSYFTSTGNVFVMAHGWDRPLQVEVGSTPSDVRTICTNPGQHLNRRDRTDTKVPGSKPGPHSADQASQWRVAVNRKAIDRAPKTHPLQETRDASRHPGSETNSKALKRQDTPPTPLQSGGLSVPSTQSCPVGTRSRGEQNKARSESAPISRTTESGVRGRQPMAPPDSVASSDPQGNPHQTRATSDPTQAMDDAQLGGDSRSVGSSFSGDSTATEGSPSGSNTERCTSMVETHPKTLV